ncbi:hypothetical protein SUGI_0868800 [Cryptomeria japonica]|nr:hypothetical protein SUGI_0868800 [Cryptomeria japonica]
MQGEARMCQVPECRRLPVAVQQNVSCNYRKDGLFNRLKRSIDALDDDEKQCFSDLAAFPQRKYIRASSLLDIWVHVRRMNREKAVVLLLKFAARHLLHLTRNIWLPSIRDDCLNSFTFSQDDVQRNLALSLVELYNRIHFRRMYVFEEQTDLYTMRQTDGYQSSEAQIVSVHTGAMTDTQLPQMDFPEAEALVLYFRKREYCIPRFLFEMEKLKILIIHNDSGKRVKLNGLDNFQLPSHLQSLHLEMVKVSSLLEHCKVLGSLEKIRFSGCEGLGRDTMFDFPGLLECYFESCRDLEELPAGICSSISLKVLSIADCGCLRKLPEDLDKLGSLKEMRLCGYSSLDALPPSICKFTKLEILDVSGFFVLHEEGQSVLKETLQKLAKIQCLRCVICDKRIKELFESNFRSGLLKFVVV